MKTEAPSLMRLSRRTFRSAARTSQPRAASISRGGSRVGRWKPDRRVHLQGPGSGPGCLTRILGLRECPVWVGSLEGQIQELGLGPNPSLDSGSGAKRKSDPCFPQRHRHPAVPRAAEFDHLQGGGGQNISHSQSESGCLCLIAEGNGAFATLFLSERPQRAVLNGFALRHRAG